MKLSVRPLLVGRTNMLRNASKFMVAVLLGCLAVLAGCKNGPEIGLNLNFTQGPQFGLALTFRPVSTNLTPMPSLVKLP